MYKTYNVIHIKLLLVIVIFSTASITTQKAKTLLTTCNLFVAKAAYQVGFKQAQSFNKKFKRNRNLAPLQFKQTFN